MPLPTPLTAVQVAGAAKDTNLSVIFRQGASLGQALFVSKADPNLQASIDEGSVFADPSVDATPIGTPDARSMSPLTVVEGTREFTVLGVYFTPDLIVSPSHGSLVGQPVITSTSIIFTLNLAGQASSLVTIRKPDLTPINAFNITVTPLAPTNSVPPAITGTPTEGQTLTVSNGTWTGSPTFARQWLRGGTNIAGATAVTYVPVQADVAAMISCRVTATNAGGSLPVVSNAVGPIVDV